jgi:hypothetical protein
VRDAEEEVAQGQIQGTCFEVMDSQGQHVGLLGELYRQLTRDDRIDVTVLVSHSSQQSPLFNDDSRFAGAPGEELRKLPRQLFDQPGINLVISEARAPRSNLRCIDLKLLDFPLQVLTFFLRTCG